VLFHVQSEDSGRSHPHVITHLYHGGTILASEKTSYADRLADPDLPGAVKALMESQHKGVLRRLVSGEFDALIAERLGPEALRGEPRVAGRSVAAPPPPAAPAEPPVETDAATLREPAPGERSFGAGIVSERPLDEVILDYLVQSARQRKRRAQ
jgi:hypothetical protein